MAWHDRKWPRPIVIAFHLTRRVGLPTRLVDAETSVSTLGLVLVHFQKYWQLSLEIWKLCFTTVMVPSNKLAPSGERQSGGVLPNEFLF